MSLSEEIEKLRKQYEDGVLTADEFAQAKRTVLASANRPIVEDAARDRHFHTIERQNEIMQLDHAWLLEREQYMMTGKNGGRYFPGKGSSIAGGVVMVLFSLFMLSFVGGQRMPGEFLLIGLLPLTLGVSVSVYSYLKAEAYEKAEAAYQSRRAELLGREE